MNEPRINSVPLMAKEAGFASKTPELAITREQVFSLEQEIPVTVLYDAVLKLEEKLKTRTLEQGYRIWDDDLSNNPPQYPDEFAHILEHAILAVIDNNLSTSGVLSTGRTFNRGFEDRKDPVYTVGSNTRISHGHEVRVSFAPSIPQKFHQEYLDHIVKAIREQYDQTKAIDLALIELK